MSFEQLAFERRAADVVFRIHLVKEKRLENGYKTKLST